MSKKGSFVAKSFLVFAEPTSVLSLYMKDFIVAKNSRVMRMEGKAGLYSIRVVHWGLKSSLRG